MKRTEEESGLFMCFGCCWRLSFLDDFVNISEFRRGHFCHFHELWQLPHPIFTLFHYINSCTEYKIWIKWMHRNSSSRAVVLSLVLGPAATALPWSWLEMSVLWPDQTLRHKVSAGTQRSSRLCRQPSGWLGWYYRPTVSITPLNELCHSWFDT